MTPKIVVTTFLCLTLANPTQGFSAGFRASFPPAAAPDLVEFVGQTASKKRPSKPRRLPFRKEPTPGDVNLGPVVKARPGKNDRLIGRVPNSRRTAARDDAAANLFMGLMLGAAAGALSGVSTPSRSYHSGGSYRNRGYGGGGNDPSSAHHCSVDYTTPNPTSLYCR